MTLATPVPFDEGDVGKPDWEGEPWDKNLPSLGFIRDFVYYTRRIETPTKMSTWTAVFILSSVLKRETYLKWFPHNMYPNFYVFLVGPPRVCGKGTVMGIAETLLNDFHENYDDGLLREVKRINLLRSRATPESISLALTPEEAYIHDGKMVRKIERGSQLTLIIPELATFFGKQKYNMGKVDLIGHLYDCKDRDDELTIGRGKLLFENVYITLIGGATKEHLQETLPDVTFGGGFMSRVIIAYEPKATRCYPETGKPLGSPDLDDLSYRLAWIGENSQGAYVFSEEAREAHKTWYYRFRDHLEVEMDEKKLHTLHRMDVHLRKLSVIIRAQRYEKGHDITLNDYQEAQKLLNATYETSYQSIQDVGAGDTKKWLNRILNLLNDKPRGWNELLRAMSPYGCLSQNVYGLVGQLMEEGRIECLVGSEKKNLPARKASATYRLKS